MLPAESVDAFRLSLTKGAYSLLLGSGVSLDSTNGDGESLQSASALARALCILKGAPEATSLARVAALLDPEEVSRHITVPYSRCTPGPTIAPIGRYLWRRIYSFNVDDAIEALYSTAHTQQSLTSINYCDPYYTPLERSELPLIHLHGFVGRPGEDYVFSVRDYARIMRENNPWMHVLSELISTEPFIISGTSLSESDLEYYLSSRSQTTPRRDRGPSILVEPYPNVVTRADCDRHGLILVEATFSEFMNWVMGLVPAPPTVHDLTIPSAATKLISDSVGNSAKLRFFTAFESVVPTDRQRSPEPTPFLYGRPPEWSDIQSAADIIRMPVTTWTNAALARLQRPPQVDPGAVIFSGDPGTGKTTFLMRLGYELARSGTPVFFKRSLANVDVEATRECLRALPRRCVVVIDGLADHAQRIAELFDDPAVRSKSLLIASERVYRLGFVETVFGRTPDLDPQPLTEWSVEDHRRLIERFREYGLVGDSEAVRLPGAFASKIATDPVAVAVCRILSDFRPLADITDSLWRDADITHRLPFLCVAIAEYCRSGGVLYSMLQNVVSLKTNVGDLFAPSAALRLTPNPSDDDYVTTWNAAVAQVLLERIATREPELLRTAFIRLAASLAPLVNRQAIMRRTAEARLAGRLFDVDTVITPLLGPLAEDFFVRVQQDWQWNSRYWEQRALLVLETDLESAVRYARHAVAIESHPFPLTTLGKVLLRRMESSTRPDADFSEAFDVLTRAIRSEVHRSRVTIHPYSTLFAGIVRYMELEGPINGPMRQRIEQLMADAQDEFYRDAQLRDQIARVDMLLNASPNSRGD